MKASTITISANGNEFVCELEDNSSAKALAQALADGPIAYDAVDYGGFEKVGSLGMTLPTNDKQINTVPGDVILYQGDKLVIYYDTNSWSFTKIGHIKDVEDIKAKLGSGTQTITLSL